MITLEEKRVALQLRLDIATKNFQKARQRKNNAEHEVRKAQDADEGAHIAYNVARAQVKNFKVFCAPGKTDDV